MTAAQSAGDSGPLTVYVGWDPREVAAFDVTVATLKARASVPVRVVPLKRRRLERAGLLTRVVQPVAAGDRRLVSGRWYTFPAGTLWDVTSGAPMATEFAVSRFLVPALAQSGWALFVDCDVVFLGDVAELLEVADPQYAVQVVKHGELPGEGLKMDGQPQLAYPRKNWSSVVLWNCDHAGNRRLTLREVNGWPGRDLHAFRWLADEHIGSLPAGWNWLVGVQPRPPDPKVAHFTLGGPWLPGWKGAEHDQLWVSAAATVRP
jgi:hypothetical protein